MGLTLHYEMRLPAAKSVEDVQARIESLRAVATALPFRQVSPVVRLADRTASPEHEGWRHALRFFAGVIAEPFQHETPALHGDVDTSLGFVVNPGEGCDSAMFGLMRRADRDGRHAEWFWYSFCKTQYATAVSDEHFLTCHVSLVKLLEAAIGLGIDVSVYDEGEYWETRNEAELVRRAAHMNRVVARFAGKLSDALGPSHAVEAPIFSHPRFERLEMGE
ncbi:MAG TPA: hypothetical protein VF178_07540 [Gemmatimonadaceae bacterium]